MSATATRTNVKVKIVDERLRFPLCEAARVPGEVDRVESIGISLVVDGNDHAGDPAHNRLLGEIELPADADHSTVQVWLPQQGERIGPFSGVPECMTSEGRRWFVLGAHELLDVAANPSNSRLGLRVISDHRQDVS